MDNGEELSQFWKKAQNYAIAHGLAHYAQDFASWAVLERIKNPKRFWLKNMLIDFKRIEFGDSRYDKKHTKRLIYLSNPEGDVEITDDTDLRNLSPVLAAIAEADLSERERICLILQNWIGFTQAEIAAILGISPARVYQNMCAALEKMRGNYD